MSDFVAENPSTGRGVNALAMDDENGSRDRPPSIRTKRSNSSLRLFSGRPMKIECVEHRQETTGELAEPLTEPHPGAFRGVSLAAHLKGGRNIARKR